MYNSSHSSARAMRSSSYVCIERQTAPRGVSCAPVHSVVAVLELVTGGISRGMYVCMNSFLCVVRLDQKALFDQL